MDFRQDVGEETASELAAGGTCKFFQCETPIASKAIRNQVPCTHARWGRGRFIPEPASCAAAAILTPSGVLGAGKIDDEAQVVETFAAVEREFGALVRFTTMVSNCSSMFRAFSGG